MSYLLFTLYLLMLPFDVALAQKNKEVGQNFLYHIQRKIEMANAESFVMGDIAPLNKIQAEIYKDREKHKDNPNLHNYWLSYIDYYKTIVFMPEPEEAEKFLTQGIKRLEDTLSDRNSEEHSLLAMLESYSIVFSAGIKAQVIQQKVEARCARAMELDAENPRPYFVLGSLDYYTPPMFGGQKKCERYLLKTIALPEQKIKNPYFPSWGKAEAYTLLIEFYLHTKQKEQAKKYFKEGRAAYPDNYRIKILAEKFID